MNEVLKNILTRRSIRSFTEERSPDEAVEQIVQAAIYAPSGRNLQSWHFTVIHDRDKIARMAAVMQELLGNPNYNLYKPDMLILVAADRENSLGQLDTGCAMENIFLAAHSLGIGSVWVNQLYAFCDKEPLRALLTEYGLPETHVVWGTAALGYAAGPAAERPRAEGTVNYA